MITQLVVCWIIIIWINTIKWLLQHETFPYVVLNVCLLGFCLSFVSETKVLYDVLLCVQLKRR